MLEMMLQGTAVSKGISIGEVFLLDAQNEEGPLYPQVLIGRSISIEKLAGWDISKILGIALEEEDNSLPLTEYAREKKIPAVFGVGNLVASTSPGEQVIVDGYRGEVYIRPGAAITLEYSKYQKDDIRSTSKLSLSLAISPHTEISFPSA